MKAYETEGASDGAASYGTDCGRDILFGIICRKML